MASGMAAVGMTSLEAKLEGEKMSTAKLFSVFVFGGLGGSFGNRIKSSILFGLAFSAVEGITDKILKAYGLVVMPRYYRYG